MSKIHNLLAQRAVLVLDGSMGFELERRGARMSKLLFSSELLLTNPDLVKQVHTDYLVAGADVITTNTYQASRENLIAAGLASSDKQADKILVEAVNLARAAVQKFGNPSKAIAASIGPYGSHLSDGSEYTGNYAEHVSYEALQQFHTQKVLALISANPDLLCFETVPSLIETRVIHDTMSRLSVPYWISFSVKMPGLLADGSRLSDAIKASLPSHPNLVAIGINCLPMNQVSYFLDLMKPHVGDDLPLLVYPNNGGRWDPELKIWQDLPEDSSWSSAFESWTSKGARLIGGCCTTGPAHIRQLDISRQQKALSPVNSVN